MASTSVSPRPAGSASILGGGGGRGVILGAGTPGAGGAQGRPGTFTSGGALPHIAHHALEGLCAVPEGADATVPVTLIRGRLRLPLRPAGHNPDTARREVTSGPRPGPQPPPPRPQPRCRDPAPPVPGAPGSRSEGGESGKAGARARPQQEPPPLDTRTAAGHQGRWTPGAAAIAAPLWGGRRRPHAAALAQRRHRPRSSPRCPGGERGGRRSPAQGPRRLQSRPGAQALLPGGAPSCLP